MQYDYKEVDYEKYCKICKHKDVDIDDDPCNECLEYPINLHSYKPVKYEEK